MKSPIDRLGSFDSVGKLRIHMQPKPITEGLKSAEASVLINPGPKQVELTGIRVREARRGWVVLDLPPLDAWESSLGRLSPPQRERIEAPTFFELLQRELPRRLLSG